MLMGVSWEDAYFWLINCRFSYTVCLCFFSAATNQVGFSPLFHILSISDLCIKKLKNDLNWNEKVFSCYLCVFKWMSLGYILQICFIKTLNVELCPCGSIIFIKLSSVCMLLHVFLDLWGPIWEGKRGHFGLLLEIKLRLGLICVNANLMEVSIITLTHIKTYSWFWWEIKWFNERQWKITSIDYTKTQKCKMI